MSSTFKQNRQISEVFHKLQTSFVSVQGEKAFLRDKMLNTFIDMREKKPQQFKSVEDVVKLKKSLIEEYCEALHTRLSQHSLRAQIMAYYYSLQELLSKFPTTRESHFMFGEALTEESKEVPDDFEVDPTQFMKRPRRVLSKDGNVLTNLWYIPHHTEVLQLFRNVSDAEANSKLKILLRLVSALHDICQYLCAHARLGSSHARMGSQKMEFSGVTADWGGTEGIGAELRDIQRQMNKLKNPRDCELVASFLEKKRDIMYLEFDITISHAVRDTFLSTGNQEAYQCVTRCMHYALQNLGNCDRSSLFDFQITLPEPLSWRDKLASDLFPWQSLLKRSGQFPCSYWQFHRIGNLMQCCLSGLKDIDRHVVNGEVLGISLLLEDVLSDGLPDISFLDTDTQPNKERELSGKKSRSTTPAIPKDSNHRLNKILSLIGHEELKDDKPDLALAKDPLMIAEFIRSFLLLWARLAIVKKEWGCRRLGVSGIDSIKLYQSLCNTYKVEVLHGIYTQIASKTGQADKYLKASSLGEDEELEAPENTTEYEIVTRQLVRLLENLECIMIQGCIRKVSREQTLVVSERNRDDSTLPTDLWKKGNMKENFTTSRPEITVRIAEQLLTNSTIQEDTITIDKEHFDRCMVHLGTKIMCREKQAFESYATFYENLLRQQHQSIYMKEQEVKHLNDVIEQNAGLSSVEVDSRLADKSHHLLSEVTALRARVSEMSQYIVEQDQEIREQLQREYNDLVIELFNNSFEMKNRFEQFRSSLYDDVFESLSEVRKIAVAKMKKVRQKYGLQQINEDATSQKLIRADQLRQAQWESKNLASMILKQKTVNQWNRTKNKSRFRQQLLAYQEVADKEKKDCLEIKLLHEEKEILMKQEQAALRKALAHLEKDCQDLRHKLNMEHKLQVQRSHLQIQETQSMRKLELAKQSNLEKLLAELEEKELRLQELSGEFESLLL